MELTAILIVTASVKILIDWTRKLIPAIDGMVVNLVALGLGYGATYIEGVGDFDSWVSRFGMAVAISGTTHLFAEATGALHASKERNLIDGGVD